MSTPFPVAGLPTADVAQATLGAPGRGRGSGQDQGQDQERLGGGEVAGGAAATARRSWPRTQEHTILPIPDLARRWNPEPVVVCAADRRTPHKQVPSAGLKVWRAGDTTGDGVTPGPPPPPHQCTRAPDV